jgi:hypothetical protein
MRPEVGRHRGPLAWSGAVLGEFAKRVINLVVVVLAAITFFLVPLGSKTLYQHVRAIFATPAADELGRELKKTGEDVAREVKNGVAAAPSAGK